MRVRVVRSRQPHLTAAVPRGVEVLPRLEPRIARVHRHGVELPLQLAGLRIERLEEPRRVEIVAGADQHVIADHDRRRRGEILLGEAGDFLVPALLPRSRIERHQIVVRRFHVETVAPHAEPAVADVRAALRLPEVVPQLVAVVRIERPGVVRRRHVEHAVHRQDRALDRHRAADDDVARAFAADRRDRARRPDWRRQSSARAGTGRHLADPRQRQALHVRLVDLRERAVAPAGVVAGVGRPRVGERLEDLRRIEIRARGKDDGGRDTQRRDQNPFGEGRHLSVTR